MISIKKTLSVKRNKKIELYAHSSVVSDKSALQWNFSKWKEKYLRSYTDIPHILSLRTVKRYSMYDLFS